MLNNYCKTIYQMDKICILFYLKLDKYFIDRLGSRVLKDQLTVLIPHLQWFFFIILPIKVFPKVLGVSSIKY